MIQLVLKALYDLTHSLKEFPLEGEFAQFFLQNSAIPQRLLTILTFYNVAWKISTHQIFAYIGT